PRRIGQRDAVADTQPKLRTVVRPTPNYLDRLLEIVGDPGEAVQQERVVGDLGRYPVRLRIDGSKPAHRHEPLSASPDEVDDVTRDDVRLLELQEMPRTLDD